MTNLFRYCQFYCLGSFRQQPYAIAALGAASLVALVCFGFVVANIEHRGRLKSELASLTANARPAPVVGASAAPTSSEDSLPTFSSADLSLRFHDTATGAGLLIDEVAYALDASPAQPYLRYRVTFSVKSGYPEIRRFVAALAAEFPNVALDSIRCGREDIAASALSCDLAFSAFFRKGSNG